MLAIAFQFLYIGWRLRSDRSYAAFGGTLAFACLTFLPVVWLHPGSGAAPWHILALSLLLAVLSFLILTIMGGWRRSSAGGDRFRSTLLLSGCGVAAIGMLADMLHSMDFLPGVSVTFLGFAGFAGIADYVLISRFLEINRRTQSTVDRLASAYALLQDNAGLRELGASAAMISHEIRNYVSTLKGNALLMGKTANATSRLVQVEAIREVAHKMEVVSRDIAAFAGSWAPVAGGSVSLEKLIRGSIDRHFQSRQADFRLRIAGGSSEVAGDEAKLEQVFLNLARNSFEAGAKGVEIRIRPWRDRLILAFEDDGDGCAAEDLAKIATPFYTEKRDRGGTGLGCSIAASILKSHGASFRMYSKNPLGDGRKGMIVNMVFPKAAEDPGKKRDVVVIAGGPETRLCILQPLFNLGEHPYLLSGDDVPSALRGTLRHPVFLMESGGAGPRGADWRTHPVFIVDALRVAHREGPGAGRQAGPFLLSEENMVSLVLEGAGE